jgi:hypothetical protein
VGGRNQNYVSAAGTSYHIQIEDLGPVFDRALEADVRRVNLIVYANYGEPNARIVHATDYDFTDVRTAEYNRVIESNINELVNDARALIEQRERREVGRIKGLLREYYLTKEENAKREFEAANAEFPFLFSAAWKELKGERSHPGSAVPAAPAPPAAPVQAHALKPAPAPSPFAPPRAPTPAPAPPSEFEELVFELAGDDILYPLDGDLRQKVLEIERLIIRLGNDLRTLKQQGGADDILLQTCRKLVMRAKETIAGRDTEFNARRLDMAWTSLSTTWRQIRSRLKAQ